MKIISKKQQNAWIIVFCVLHIFLCSPVLEGGFSQYAKHILVPESIIIGVSDIWGVGIAKPIPLYRPSSANKSAMETHFLERTSLSIFEFFFIQPDLFVVMISAGSFPGEVNQRWWPPGLARSRVSSVVWLTIYGLITRAIAWRILLNGSRNRTPQRLFDSISLCKSPHISSGTARLVSRWRVGAGKITSDPYVSAPSPWATIFKRMKIVLYSFGRFSVPFIYWERPLRDGESHDGCCWRSASWRFINHSTELDLSVVSRLKKRRRQFAELSFLFHTIKPKRLRAGYSKHLVRVLRRDLNKLYLIPEIPLLKRCETANLSSISRKVLGLDLRRDSHSPSYIVWITKLQVENST